MNFIDCMFVELTNMMWLLPVFLFGLVPGIYASSNDHENPHLVTYMKPITSENQSPLQQVFAQPTTTSQAAIAIDTIIDSPIDAFTPLPANGSDPKPPTALQQHVLFWDRDANNLITMSEIYTGFRDIGFSIPYSLGGLLINVFFSYPTRLAHSYLPDPFFRIYVDSIHKAKHGSDTGIYDSDGHLRHALYEELFDKFDGSGTGSLGVSELFWLLKKDRVAADPAGWSFAFMEWGTTWLLLQKGGRVWKEDLRQCYDGSLFWRIRHERLEGEGWPQGYGWREFVNSVGAGKSWKTWEHEPDIPTAGVSS